VRALLLFRRKNVDPEVEDDQDVRPVQYEPTPSPKQVEEAPVLEMDDWLVEEAGYGYGV
jgi:hypothetical protein